jgi:hypothetical protein
MERWIVEERIEAHTGVPTCTDEDDTPLLCR